MLKGTSKAIFVFVFVVGIDKEVGVEGKDVAIALWFARKTTSGWIVNHKCPLFVVLYVATKFESLVGVYTLTTRDLHIVGNTYGAVVGGKNYGVAIIAECFEHIGERASIIEPRTRQAAIGCIVGYGLLDGVVIGG